MKPCPFCGKRVIPIMRRSRDMFDSEICIEYGVICHHCGTVVYFENCYDLEHVLELWDRRAEE